MSPRAQFSDLGAKIFAPVAALARPTGSAPVRYQPANDTVAVDRMDLLARRRRRQSRREQRS
ncbi:MAG: hypothetical protein FP825_12600 [Hyphomonas sp.]|uniref:hypothetical protein n=1 Tax=Hyphomonas sp. TaxID=87 RepID=UPI0017CFE555|nr:hypothetical protein [Hyphomonas sp.]MBA3069302.1 hypothetical protein [Hyphomonas sp.]MBU4063683.1 hypothetical protein [Alphaproteobacteria bacterium]MBU4164356.1 hypothetical protein [Alphaproteobacteria bacterium]